MNAQEVFDKVVNHLRAQGEPAIDHAAGACKYRVEATGGRVLKCAIGCLIDDNDYNPDMESHNLNKLLSNEKALPLGPLRNLLTQHSQLLHWLQVTHDTFPQSSWEMQFKVIAEVYQLIYTPPAS